MIGPARRPRTNPTTTACLPREEGPGAVAVGFDWQEVREGAREVFLTLTATILLGLGWAALEAGWSNAMPTRAGDAADFETGYASLGPTAR